MRRIDCMRWHLLSSSAQLLRLSTRLDGHRGVHAACIAEPAMTPDALTARLQELLELEEPGCDCPRCDGAEYQRALAEHLIASANRRQHLRAAWENPKPRARQLSDG